MNSESLTKKAWFAFFSVFCLLLTEQLALFFERLCLSNYSLSALNGNVEAHAFLQLFQNILIVFVTMSTTLIGRYRGADELTLIGNRVWQMVWISLMLMGLVLPLSFMVNSVFFQQTNLAHSYFRTAIFGSFLFPIGATLSSFFMAIGKKRVILVSLFVTLQTSVICNLVLIPRLGVIGGAYSLLVSKCLFCIILMACFLHPTYKARYHTHKWKVDLASIWNTIRACSPRLWGRIFYFLSWIAMAYCMVKKGDVYLSIFAIGATLTFLLMCFPNGLCYSLTDLFSEYLACRQYTTIWKIFRYGLIGSLTFIGVLAIPLLAFPKDLLSIFSSQVPPEIVAQIPTTFFFVWIWFGISSLYPLFLAFLFSLKDQSFYPKLRLLAYALSLIQVYWLVYHLSWEPNTFWAILCVENFLILSACALRAYFVGKAHMRGAISSTF